MVVEEFLKRQIDEIFGEFQSLRERSNHEDLSDLPESIVVRTNMRARALFHRIFPPYSPYVKQCEEIVKRGGYAGYQARELAGIVDSLRADVGAGFLRTQSELLHGEVFADFLEMSQHLLDEGYKDAAAVVAGSSLEVHLRQLAIKAGIEVEFSRDDRSLPKKADRLNSDLANANVYSKLDSKSITAWFDLRNKSAHGHYDQYESKQVGIMIAGIREFMTRCPA